VETRLAATRSAAASSLGIDKYGLDKKFASNCIDARIKTLLEKARLANQPRRRRTRARVVQGAK
jgi:hypothetical protein